MLLTNKNRVINVSVTTFSKECCGPSLASLVRDMGYLAGGTYPVANLIIYFPFRISNPCIFTKLWWYNGASASASYNIDMGIFSEDGTRIISTSSTAQSGSNLMQSVDITDTLLDIGTYYFGFVCDTTSANFMRCTLATGFLCPVTGILEQASTFPLPANATFASATNNYFPFIGGHVSPRTLI